MILRRGAAALFVAASFSVSPGSAAAQEPPGIVIDDPTGALGDARPAVEQAAGLGDGTFAVSVVPSLDGRSVEEVVAERFAVLVPVATPYDLLLLLVVDERTGVFEVRDPATVVAEQGELVADALYLDGLESGSRAATQAFESGDAGAAAFAGIAGYIEAEADEDDDSDPGPKAFLTWLIPVLLFFGSINLVRGIKARRRWCGLSGGPTPVGELSPGTATVVGTAVTDDPQRSRIAGRNCVYWHLTVAEEWQEIKVTTRSKTDEYTGDRLRVYADVAAGEKQINDGKVLVSEEEGKRGIHVVGSDGGSVPFYVRDDTGNVLVVPDRAVFDGQVAFRESVDRSSPYFDVIPGAREHRYSKGVRDVLETIVPVDEPVTVVGPVEIEDGRRQIRWTRRLGPGAKHPFLITVQEPKGLERDAARQMIRRFVLAGACFVGIIGIVALVAERA